MLTLASARATQPGEPEEKQNALAIPPRGLISTVIELKYEAGMAYDLNAPAGAPIGGEPRTLERVRILVIPLRCKTPDSTAHPISAEELRKAFFGDLLSETHGERASVADYLRAASFGAITSVTGEVADWVVLDSSFASYLPPQTPTDANPKPFRDYYEAALKEVERLGKIRWREFDDDGRSLNVADPDDDGFVDIVVFVAGEKAFPGAFRWKLSFTPAITPAAGGPSAWESQVKTFISTEPGGVPYETNLKVDDFVAIPWQDFVDGSIGVPCHEMMHFLGVPDGYSRKTNWLGGVGRWCVMGVGCRQSTKNSAQSTSAKWPPLPSAPCRFFLGWGSGAECAVGGAVLAQPARDTGTYAIVRPAGNPVETADLSEACLVEYYTPPTSASPWGRCLELPPETSGYLVWHVDGSVGRDGSSNAYVWPFSVPYKGQNDNLYNGGDFTARPLARCVQADGNLDIEFGQKKSRSYADAGDLFQPGQRLRFDKKFKGFSWYRHDNHGPEVVFEPEGVVSASLVADHPPVQPPAPAGALPAAPSPASAAVLAAPEETGPMPGAPLSRSPGSTGSSTSTLPRSTSGAGISSGLDKGAALQEAMKAESSEGQIVEKSGAGRATEPVRASSLSKQLAKSASSVMPKNTKSPAPMGASEDKSAGSQIVVTGAGSPAAAVAPTSAAAVAFKATGPRTPRAMEVERSAVVAASAEPSAMQSKEQASAAPPSQAAAEELSPKAREWLQEAAQNWPQNAREKVTSFGEDMPLKSPQALNSLVDGVERYGKTLGSGEAGFHKEVRAALRAACTPNVKADASFLDRLAGISSPAIDAVSASLKYDDAIKLNELWKEQRTYSLKNKKGALESLKEKAALATGQILSQAKLTGSSEKPAALVRAPDGASVQELHRLNLPLAAGAQSPMEDAGLRITELNQLAGIKNSRITLKVNALPPAVADQSLQRVGLGYVASIGGEEYPLASTHHWGSLTYEKNMLQSIKFGEPTYTGNLPEAVQPMRTASEAVEYIREKLKFIAPRKEDIQVSLELFPLGQKTRPDWVPAYRIGLPLPNGTHSVIYLHADTLERL